MTLTKISHFFLVSISVLGIIACSNDDSDIPNGKKHTDMEIRLLPKVSTIADATSGRSRSLSRADGIEYPSHIITKENFMDETPSVHMVCVNQNTNSQVFRKWMNSVEKQSMNGEWIFWWQPDQRTTDDTKRDIYLWPEDENVKYSFYAVANTYKHMTERDNNGFRKFNSELSELNNGIVTYNYNGCDNTAYGRPVAQDILYACTPNISRPSDPDYRVPLTFKHAMACLEFEFKNNNPNIQIFIDNIHVQCFAAGKFKIIPSDDNDPAKTTVEWYDLTNNTSLSYNTGQYIMRPIYMRGKSDSYIAQFKTGEKAFIEYEEKGVRYHLECEIDQKLAGKNFYHLIPPQSVSTSVSDKYIALWLRMDNLNAATPPTDFSAIIPALTDYSLEYSITSEQQRELYTDTSSSFYGWGFIRIPMGCEGVSELLPGKKYRYKIVFDEGAGWNNINVQQSLLPIKTSVTVKDFENGGDFNPLSGVTY